MLEGLGIDGVAARLYHALIRLGEGDQAELAQRSALTAAQVQAGLASLEAVGLVTQRDDRVIAFRPEQAIEAAVAEREGRLARARTAGQLLANEYRADQPPRVSGDVVEIIEGREAIVARHQQLQRQAQAEIITFESPPYLSDVTQLNHAELSRLDSLRHEVAAGEEARVLPEVPLKMSVVDRTAALVPLTMDPDGFEHAIVLGPCTLLDALVGLFDVLWTRAIPLAQIADVTVHGYPIGDGGSSRGSRMRYRVEASVAGRRRPVRLVTLRGRPEADLIADRVLGALHSDG